MCVFVGVKGKFGCSCSCERHILSGKRKYFHFSELII